MVNYNGICHTHPLYVLSKDLCTLSVVFIADQNSFALHCCCDLGTLTARRRTQIQDPLPRLCCKKRYRCHGTCLLDIINSCLMERMFTRSVFAVKIVTIFFPWNLCQGKGA